MIYNILESIRYTLTLLFGIFVSVLCLDIRINKKNVICLFLFFYTDLVLQGIFYFTKDLSAVISLYPFSTYDFTSLKISSLFTLLSLPLTCGTIQ